MAPQQSIMTKFLYEGRVDLSRAESDAQRCIAAQVHSSRPVLLGTPSHTSPVVEILDDIDVPPSASKNKLQANPLIPLASNPDVVILDPCEAEPANELSRAKRVRYEQNRQWQDTWAARLPWAENVVNADGQIRQVRCKICSEVEGKEKLLVPKLDSLWKHCDRRKATNSFGKVEGGQYYFLSNNAHVKNEKKFYARLGTTGDSILLQVVCGTVKERRRKVVQFRAVLWLLMQGRPLSQFEDMREFLFLLSILDFSKKHWSIPVGWEMADHLAKALADHTKQVIFGSRFFSLSADEVSTIDSQSWLSLHLYMCIGFKRVPILLSLSRLQEGNGAQAVKESIEGMLLHYNGLTRVKIASCLVCFGADGVSVFQGSRNGVTVQMQQYMAPFMFGVHCMAHRTNLAVEPLSNLPIVAKLESLYQAMYSYFSHSPKRHLEFQKLADLVETEGRRMLKNVKICWISLLEPLRRVMGEYKTLVAKMCQDAAVKEPAITAKQAAARESARHNYELLCDVGTLLGLPCLMPLLESVNSLMKFAQSNHVFVQDYVATIKICQAELYMMYSDQDTAWQKQHFEMFHDILNDQSYSMSQEWVTDLNTGGETLAFRIAGHTYPAHSICALTGKKVPVTREDLAAVVTSVKGQCEDAAEMLSLELDVRFPQVELMSALGVVFPQYWLQVNCEDLFSLHVTTLKSVFGVVRQVNFGTEVEPEWQQVDPLFDGRLLTLQMSLFKLTIKSHAKAALEEPRDQNPLIKMWIRIGQNALMLNRLSEFFKVAEVAICTVLGSVEDECTFSTLSFMKSKLRNKLSGHVDTCVKLFSQDFFTLESFPVSKAISLWRKERLRRGIDM